MSTREILASLARIDARIAQFEHGEERQHLLSRVPDALQAWASKAPIETVRALARSAGAGAAGTEHVTAARRSLREELARAMGVQASRSSVGARVVDGQLQIGAVTPSEARARMAAGKPALGSR